MTVDYRRQQAGRHLPIYISHADAEWVQRFKFLGICTIEDPIHYTSDRPSSSGTTQHADCSFSPHQTDNDSFHHKAISIFRNPDLTLLLTVQYFDCHTVRSKTVEISSTAACNLF